jgi:hypothetical protein
MKRRVGVLGSLGLAILTAGCFVEVRHTDDPTRAFAHARAEARSASRRPGRADQVNVLVYEKDDRQLVKVSLPLWIARKIAKHEGAEIDLEDDEVGERVRGRLQHRLRFEDLEKAGRGMLLEVDDDDGSQVLVWLR